ncbi:uncharacterized protein CELE_C03B1.7 [Caenorhabditis elegans]|nr:Uncharacterized protein CELE_C03B1.7 [Caenorhabditis elegans]CCD62749.1 Uncharacterized protein CELE_C03B1.7 [Caenorhabditis elegans]|eukprot:NP_001257041.1 Uncharacterized protein CELE_C03B1.7 [Caenorhabditis elegans]
MDRNISGVSVKDYETLKNFEDKSPPQAENASSSKKDEPISVECTDETSSRLSPATDISHEMAEHGTPDSGMISDVSEIKVLPAGKIEKKLIKELNPEMMVGRDGRRYRQKLREAEKQATVEFKLENFEQTNGEAQSVENDILTGKEKRRLKDKLRKEKKEQSKLFVEKDLEKNKESSSASLSTNKLAESPTEADKNSNVIHTNIKPKDICIETEYPANNDNKKKSEVMFSSTVTNVFGRNENQTSFDVKEHTVDSFELLPGEYRISNFGQQMADTTSAEMTALGKMPQEAGEVKPTVREHSGANFLQRERNFPLSLKTTVIANSPEGDIEGKRLSKGQKRRARNKANKGVYVVNENGSHSIELLPGEYKLLELDENKKIQEFPIDTRHYMRDDQTGGGSKIVEQGQRTKKKKNFYVAGNLSKNILDNGKWLAYVIDDKNSDGVPRVGEVSTEEVQETIKLLDSKISHNAIQDNSCSEDFEFGSSSSTNFVTGSSRSLLPELDADFVRKTLADYEENATEDAAENNNEVFESASEELEMFMNSEGIAPNFHSEFAKKTSPLLVGNAEFKDFCSKYSNSKYDNKTISKLVKKYIDTRIVHHYERFKKLADRESHRIAKSWTKIYETSSYSLMVMLYTNSPSSSVGFSDLEEILFNDR